MSEKRESSLPQQISLENWLQAVEQVQLESIQQQLQQEENVISQMRGIIERTVGAPAFWASIQEPGKPYESPDFD